VSKLKAPYQNMMITNCLTMKVRAIYIENFYGLNIKHFKEVVF
jgi:hypothetical protein